MTDTAPADAPPALPGGRRRVRAVGVVVGLLVAGAAISGVAFLTTTASDEEIAKNDARLTALELDLEKASRVLDEIGSFFPGPDRDQGWSEPDAMLKSPGEYERLAATYGSSNEATATRLEEGIRIVEKSLTAVERLSASPQQREHIASQRRRASLLRQAVDPAKTALGNARHLRSVPALVEVLRENDAAYAEVLGSWLEIEHAPEGANRAQEEATVVVVNKKRLRPSLALTRSAVARFGRQTGYEGVSDCLDDLRTRERLSNSLYAYSEAVYRFNGDTGPVDKAWDEFIDTYLTATSDTPWLNDDARPSWFLLGWYGFEFGQHRGTIDDRVEESRRLKQ